LHGHAVAVDVVKPYARQWKQHDEASLASMAIDLTHIPATFTGGKSKKVN
jgi:hypothetical protein